MAKILELQLQHQSSSEYSGLISFRIDWLELFAALCHMSHSSRAAVGITRLLPPAFCKSLLLFSLWVTSDSLWSHGLQGSRLPYLSLCPRDCSDSCPLSRWCHPTISSSVFPFSCLPFFPASGSFPMSQLFVCRSLCSLKYTNCFLFSHCGYLPALSSLSN